MKRNNLTLFFSLIVFMVCGATSAQASVIFLAGSEAASYHHIDEYTNPVFQQLQGTSTLPVLVINDFGASAGFYSDTGGVSVVYTSPAAFSTATLSDYSTLFFASPGTCCSDPAGLLGSRGGDVGGFVAGGGSLYVEDYQGLEAWDSIIGLTVPDSAITSGAPSPVCEDPGVSTPGGLAFGFAPSYDLGCFQHQTYDPTYWAANGYFALQVAGAEAANTGDWVTMATGFVDPDPTVPEPATLALMGLGLAGIGFARRKKQS